MNRTVKRSDAFAALLIAVEGEHEITCMAIIRASGMNVTRVVHVAGALERIPVLQPKLIVIPASKKSEAKESLEDRAVATGADVVWIEPNTTREELKALLTNAIHTVVSRAA